MEIKNNFKDELKKLIKEIESNSNEQLKKIYTKDILNGGFLVKKKDKFINHYTRDEAEMILNNIHQSNNIKKSFKKAIKKEFGTFLKKFKIKVNLKN